MSDQPLQPPVPANYTELTTNTALQSGQYMRFVVTSDANVGDGVNTLEIATNIFTFPNISGVTTVSTPISINNPININFGASIIFGNVAINTWIFSTHRITIINNSGGTIVITGSNGSDIYTTSRQPNTTYYVYRTGDNIYLTDSISSLSSPSASCFSKNTFLALINQKNILPIAMVQSIRGNKKMYRCVYPPYGTIEFTYDHPFTYKGKIYPFEELVKIHPIMKQTAKEISLDDKECGANAKIYNILGDINQLSKKNMFEFGPQLNMIGGLLQPHCWAKLAKKANIVKQLNNADVTERYTMEKFIECGQNYDDVEFII
jgi:hypothetical protein